MTFFSTMFTLYIVTGFSVWALWGSQLPGSRKARNPNDASRSEGARPLQECAVATAALYKGHCNRASRPARAIQAAAAASSAAPVATADAEQMSRERAALAHSMPIAMENAHLPANSRLSNCPLKLANP